MLQNRAHEHQGTPSSILNLGAWTNKAKFSAAWQIRERSTAFDHLIRSHPRETRLDCPFAQLTCSSSRRPLHDSDHDGKLISLHWTGLNGPSLTAEGRGWQGLSFPLIPLPTPSVGGIVIVQGGLEWSEFPGKGNNIGELYSQRLLMGCPLWKLLVSLWQECRNWVDFSYIHSNRL